MRPVSIIVVFQLLLISLLVFCSHYVLFLCRRKFRAKIQHRDGSSTMGWGTFLSNYEQSIEFLLQPERAALPPALLCLVALLWVFSSILMISIFLCDHLDQVLRGGDVLFSLSMCVVALLCEELISRASSLHSEKSFSRERFLSGVLGFTGILLAVLTLILSAGKAQFSDIVYHVNRGFGFGIIRSPGIFLAAVVFWISIYFFSKEKAFVGTARYGIDGAIGFLVDLCSSLWTVSLLVMWTFLFLGGIDSIVGLLIFPVKLFFVLVVYEFLAQALPMFKVTDSPFLFISRVLWLGYLAVIFEVLWQVGLKSWGLA